MENSAGLWSRSTRVRIPSLPQEIGGCGDTVVRGLIRPRIIATDSP